MDSRNLTGLGRISHVVLESRDLDRTLDFHAELLALDPIYSGDIPKDSLVFRLAGGGRIIFKKIAPEAETRGGSQWFGIHSALTIRTEHWDEAYGRVWERTSRRAWQACFAGWRLSSSAWGCTRCGAPSSTPISSS